MAKNASIGQNDGRRPAYADDDEQCRDCRDKGQVHQFAESGCGHSDNAISKRSCRFGAPPASEGLSLDRPEIVMPQSPKERG